MKIVSVLSLSIILLLACACAQKINDPADVQAIEKSLDDYVKAVNAGDADGVAALMTDKTVYADLNLPVAVGAEAIRSQSQAFFDTYKAEFSAPVDEVRVTGDLAAARGAWSIKLTPNSPGVAGISDSGSWIVVCARQSDGSWKWDWVVPNSNQPLPGSTASGEDEQSLYQLEQEWIAAILKKDTDAVSNLMADGFVSNFDGRTQSKQQILAEMKSSKAKIEAASTSDMRAVVFGDTALVSGLYTEKSTTGGRDTSQRVRYTEVYVKRDGHWRCVTQYLTKG
jgi:uncharacterized protein (TIGR02246 family)